MDSTIIWLAVPIFCTGLLIGRYIANNYWINAANTGFRACVRGKLYTVEKTGEN